MQADLITNKSRKWVLPIIPLLLAFSLLAAAFLFLDFRLTQSETVTSSQHSTIRMGEPVLANPPLRVFVAGPEDILAALPAGLVAQLGSHFREITFIDKPLPAEDTPVLVIHGITERFLWTPVYAGSHLSIHIAFASDGRVSWTDLGEVDTVIHSSDVVVLSADLAVSDTSRGLISRRAYQRYLGQQAAARVSQVLVQSLQDNLK